MFRNLYLLLFIFSFTVLQAQNNSLFFDGDNDYVSLVNDDIFDLTDEFTLEAWIYAEQWEANSWQGTIIGKDADPTTGFVLRTGNNGTLSFTVGTGSDWNEITSGPIMSTETWHHIAAVLDNGESRIYIDGNLVSSGSCPASASSNTNTLLGESSGFSGRLFEGRIDEVRFWNVVRTNEEIADNRSVDLSNDTPGLIAYYKMDETMGTTAANFIDPGNTDGTLINFGTSSWQDGYTIPGLDLKTDAIISPDPITLASGLAQVKARFLNNGIDPVSNFQVSYSWNGADPIIEDVSLNLEPGDVYVHTFTSAVLDNGGENNLVVSSILMDDSNLLNDSKSSSFPQIEDALSVPIFVQEQHNFAAAGQTQIANISLPENNSGYEQILMNISVNCPGTGCDPWDQPAKISLLKDGVTYEIARYITPYGISCGPWTVDVTSFKSILQGDCEFISYIQVWGGSGWLLNIDLVYVPGELDYPFQKITPVYDTDYLVYGDPAISHDLTTMSLPVEAQTFESDFRLTVTGHGQGNTQNAAEFSAKTHQVMVNGNEFQDHFLWKDDCDQNDCDNQNGTWLFSRAGWCPGQAVDPLIVDITSEIIPGGMVELDYELEDYTNFLNTGYNGGSHTEPHYKLHAYLVEKSDEPFAPDGWINSTATAISSPATVAELSASTQISVDIENTGTTEILNLTYMVYLNGEFAFSEIVDLNAGMLLPGGTYTHDLGQTLDMSDLNQNYDLGILVYADNDEAANDNVISASFQLVGIDDAEQIDLSLYPNPNKGEVVLVVPNLTSQADIILLDLSGRELTRMMASAELLKSGYRITLPYAAGSYLIQVISSNGSMTKNLVIE